MKYTTLSIFLLGLSILFSSCSSNHSFSSFFKENKEDIQIHVNAPKWLTMLFVPSDDKAEVKRFSKGIKKVKLMVTENENAENMSKSFDLFTKEHGYTPYMYINDHDEQINLMAKQNGDYITEIVLKYDSSDETVLIGLLGKMHLSTFKDALKKASETD